MKTCNRRHLASTGSGPSRCVVAALAGCSGGGTYAPGKTPMAQATPNSSPFRRSRCRTCRCSRFTFTLTRTLRLTGAVAYNSFRTTPVITQVSGPVSRMVVVPGQRVRRGEPMLYVASPDFSQLRTNYLKARDAKALATSPIFARRICTSTMPSR